MKKHLLTLLAAASTFMGAHLQGSECSDDGVYVGGFAGVNFLQDMNKKVDHAKFKPGFAGGLSLGYKFENNIRVEGEFAFRRNVLRSFNGQNLATHSVKMAVETYSVMGNVLYDFDLCSDWTPYIGFGLGYAQNKAKVDHKNFDLSFKDDGFAYQGIAGVSYKICNKTNVGLEYRYFASKSEIKDHALALSLRRSF